MTRLLFPAGILLAAGLLIISSISKELFVLQIVWGALGAGFIALFWLVDWRMIMNHRAFILALYGLVIALLVVVFVSGPVIRNTRSWLVAGPIRFQPVELAKIALILLYAQYFSRRHLNIARWPTILASFAFFAVPAGLVMLQPDLGSAFVLFGIWFGFLLVSGLPRKKLLFALGAFAVAGFFLWNTALQEYQKARILGVFYPERNALTVNYSVIQSKIAIGSAGWLGKGYGQGTQTQLGFLPEAATDFVFSALIEEWGWIAGLIVVAAFLAFIIAILRVGLRADQNFEKFACLGAAIMFGWQFFLNAGSATGIFPVVGVTFPFLSYGGSSLLTSFFMLAIINAIAVRS